MGLIGSGTYTSKRHEKSRRVGQRGGLSCYSGDLKI
jgi:hypothetical protein